MGGWPWHAEHRPHWAQHAHSCMRAGVRLFWRSHVIHVQPCQHHSLHTVDAGDAETCMLSCDATQRSSPHTETDSIMTRGTCHILPVFTVVTAQPPAAWARPYPFAMPALCGPAARRTLASKSWRHPHAGLRPRPACGRARRPGRPAQSPAPWAPGEPTLPTPKDPSPANPSFCSQLPPPVPAASSLSTPPSAPPSPA